MYRISRVAALRSTSVSMAGLRPTATTHMLRRTDPNLIPPFILQIIKAVAVSAGQQFVAAHLAESQRLKQQQSENTNNNGSGGSFEETGGGAVFKPKMSPTEALQILNVNTNLALPLRGEEDRKKATENFMNYFEKAKDSDSLYLQGKLSQAYRLAVDENWDAGKQEGGKDRQ
eukprot:GILI01030319.1.p1 GENE.GILI01030319.1~~GILI01030319.1.p1  ORF type:complete len:173 (+),score=31.47 GILI01030319.1:65-583(+)